ncbi:MAG: zf-TFIIB domain-containing protein [Phycisphaerae bacterium]|jgi:Zn-finger nucleic acid-binding protein
MPHCPICKTRTDLIKYEGVPIYNCGTCGGHWLDRAKLQTIVVRREVVMPEPVKRKMIEIADASNSTQELWCLTCGKAMVKEQFKHWPEIQIDRCPKCNGIWLDRGELEKCQIYWEYVQDNPDSEEAQRAVRMAQLDARWQSRQAELRDQVDNAVEASRYGGRGSMLNLGFLARLFGGGR